MSLAAVGANAPAEAPKSLGPSRRARCKKSAKLNFCKISFIHFLRLKADRQQPLVVTTRSFRTSP